MDVPVLIVLQVPRIFVITVEIEILHIGQSIVHSAQLGDVELLVAQHNAVLQVLHIIAISVEIMILHIDQAIAHNVQFGDVELLVAQLRHV